MKKPGYLREKAGREGVFPHLCILVVVSLVLLGSGLSIRSLWGPEGRWAEIVREMIRSHNYFLPTINGVVDFDKPLLSHWLMVASVRIGGLNETMLRLPGALAAAGTVFIVFLIGRRLFSARTALFAGLILVTSPMFLFWSRIASAELLNTLSIWVMYWAFLAFRFDSKRIYLVVLYGCGAIACFFKGPVAPALCFFTILLFSAAEVVLEVSSGPIQKKRLMPIVLDKFFWLFSRPAVPGLLVGSVIFVVLLSLPIVLTKSWISGSLMWKENVVRFFHPFDHKDPPYTYAYATVLFSAPWTFLMLGSMSRFGLFKRSWPHFWAYGSALAMLLFFLISGSRRGYYILPLIPALALITADSVQALIERKGSNAESKIMSLATVATIMLLICIGAGLLFVYFSMTAYRHVSEPLVGTLAIAGSFVALCLFCRQNRMQAISLLVALLVISDLWGVTVAAKIGERERSVKEFAYQTSRLIDKAGTENVALFQQCTSELIFYLNRDSVIESVASVEEAERFHRKHPQGLLVLDLNEIPRDVRSYVQALTPLVIQHTNRDQGGRFVVVRYP